MTDAEVSASPPGAHGRARPPTGRFGEFGGRFVPETLVPACLELEAAFRDGLGRPGVPRPSSTICSATTPAGRRRSPSATACPSSSALRLLLKREDLNHTGSHKINNVLGQALLARAHGQDAGSSPRPAPASTASPPPPRRRCSASTAWCTWARSTSSARRSTCSACGCSAPRCGRRQPGSRTLKDAVNEAMRDWVATVENTHYCLGSVMGPHPYPWMVREFHRVVGDEAREQCRALLGGGDPDVVVACVGGGSNAMGIFSGFVDTDAELVGVEPAGGAAVGRGVPGVVHGMQSLPDAGRVRPGARGRSRSPPGSTTRASAPSTRTSPPSAGPLRGGHRRRGARRVPAPVAHRGHHPRARAGPRARLGRREARDELAGQDRAGQPLGPRRQGRRAGDARSSATTPAMHGALR